MKLFLSTHGTMASGMKSAIEILLGTTDGLEVFDAYVNEESVDAHIQDFLNKYGRDELKLLISDVYGGSVCQVMVNYINYENTLIITGVNLAMLFSLMTQKDTELSIGDIKNIVIESKELTRVIDLEELEHIENDDFFDGGLV